MPYRASRYSNYINVVTKERRNEVDLHNVVTKSDKSDEGGGSDKSLSECFQLNEDITLDKKRHIS